MKSTCLHAYRIQPHTIYPSPLQCPPGIPVRPRPPHIPQAYKKPNLRCSQQLNAIIILHSPFNYSCFLNVALFSLPRYLSAACLTHGPQHTVHPTSFTSGNFLLTKGGSVPKYFPLPLIAPAITPTSLVAPPPDPNLPSPDPLRFRFRRSKSIHPKSD